MARCDICQKSPQAGNNVSHSKRRTKTRWLPNVQKATIDVDGTPTRVQICTRCLRSLYKVGAKS